MNVLLRSTLLLSLLLVAVGCSNLSVDTMHDPTADFASYRTYDWAAVPEQAVTEINNQTVLGLLEDKLKAKGLLLTRESPDLRVAVHRSIKGELNTQRSGYTFTLHGVTRHNMQQGSMIVDIIDARTRQTVWRGTATGVFEFEAPPEQKLALVKEALDEMFEHYPPR